MLSETFFHIVVINEFLPLEGFWQFYYLPKLLNFESVKKVILRKYFGVSWLKKDAFDRITSISIDHSKNTAYSPGK